ncbi:Trophoblast glycoprotein [Chelonia mydas]|uniref:Trophoblast glycoprotein n=1 Tax=Chelonia mydas TaxID=8469 RepID=M7B318_CHEMY|nr:Trophoblast glycoprotein [Chelonia mydas]
MPCGMGFPSSVNPPNVMLEQYRAVIRTREFHREAGCMAASCYGSQFTGVKGSSAQASGPSPVLVKLDEENVYGRFPLGPGLLPLLPQNSTYFHRTICGIRAPACRAVTSPVDTAPVSCESTCWDIQCTVAVSTRDLPEHQAGVLEPGEQKELETASYVFFGIVLALIGVIFLMVLYLNRRGIKRWLNNLREACRDQMEGYHYRYEQDTDPRRASASPSGL